MRDLNRMNFIRCLLLYLFFCISWSWFFSFI